MKSAIKIAAFFIMATALGQAQANPVMQVYQKILKQPGTALPSTEELFSSVSEVTVAALSPAEVNAVLPLGRQCLQSSNAAVRQDGLVLFMAVSLRPDSQKLLEPFIDDLGSILSGPSGAISERHGALYILGNTRPHLSPKALAHLNAQLDDSRNSDEEMLTIAASLIENAPSDPATVHKALMAVSHRPSPGLTGGVLRQLGLSKSRTPEALTFIHTNLQQGLGLGFPGGTYKQIFYVSDVQMEEPFDQRVNACISSSAFCLVFPVRDKGTFRLIGIIPPPIAGKEDVTFEDLRPYIKKQLDISVTKVNWFSKYHVHHRVADHFRQGRVFIAGDAGHIHSPAGGQGMNTGIGDAVNLAWKLASVIRGRASAAILDTYESERIAFARTLVSSTDRLFQYAVGSDLQATMIRSLFLRYIFPIALRFKKARRTQFKLVSQIRIHYRDTSALSTGAAGKIYGGDRLPWVESQNNYQSFASLDWQIHVYGKFTEALHALSARWNLPIQSFHFEEGAKSAGLTRDAVYLLRPDGHVALVETEQNAQKIETYLSRWLPLTKNAAN